MLLLKSRSVIPWVTMLLTVMLVANPIGLEFLHGAFVSREQLSRNIFQPIVLTVAAGLIICAVVETLARAWRQRLQRRQAQRSIDADI